MIDLSIPVCPLPRDISVGDVVHLRDGQRRRITSCTLTNNPETLLLEGACPSMINRSGYYHETIRNLEWACIAVERDGVIIAGHGKKENLSCE